MSLLAFIHSDDLESFEETFTAARRLPGLRQHAHRLILPGNRIVCAESFFYGLGAGVGAPSLVGVLFDVDRQSPTVRFNPDEREEIESTLRERADLLRGAIEGSFDATAILRSIRNEAGDIVDFEILELNGHFEAFVGRRRSDLVGGRLCDLLPAFQANGDHEKLARAVASRSPFEEERLESTSSHGHRWVRVQMVPVGDGISVTYADISARKDAERVLVENQLFIEKLAYSLPEFVYVVDVDERTVSYQNREFLAELGYPAEMFARGMVSLAELVHIEDVDAYASHRKRLRTANDDEVVELTCRLRTAKDDWMWFQVRTAVFRRDALGAPVELIRTIQDVSPQKQIENELREKVRQLRLVQSELHERQEQLQELNQRLAALATTDGLTGLFNYRAFNEKLTEETRRARRYDYPLSIVFADVDDFKEFNDRFGHPAGDERLRQFARMLVEDSRDSDFVARYGGEEFAMILINTPAQDAARYAQRIVDRLNKDNSPKRLTASFGCVQLEPRDASKDDLVKRADECLYTAKRQGKNQVSVSFIESNAVGTSY